MNVLVQIPQSRLARSGVKQQVIWMTVAIKICYARHSPKSRKSRAVRGANQHIVFQVPLYRLPRAPIVEKIIGPPVVVKVSWCWCWGRNYYLAYLRKVTTTPLSAIVRKRTQAVERVSESRSVVTNSRIMPSGIPRRPDVVLWPLETQVHFT